MDWWTRALLLAFSTASLCRNGSGNTKQDWGGNALAWVSTSVHDLPEMTTQTAAGVSANQAIFV